MKYLICILAFLLGVISAMLWTKTNQADYYLDYATQSCVRK